MSRFSVVISFPRGKLSQGFRRFGKTQKVVYVFRTSCFIFGRTIAINIMSLGSNCREETGVVLPVRPLDSQRKDVTLLWCFWRNKSDLCGCQLINQNLINVEYCNAYGRELWDQGLQFKSPKRFIHSSVHSWCSSPSLYGQCSRTLSIPSAGKCGRRCILTFCH